MKTLSLVLNLEGVQLSEENKKKSHAEIMKTVVENVIIIWSAQQDKKGLNESDRRKYYKIIDLMEEAIKIKTDKIELEDDYMEFVKKCFREVHTIPDKLLQRIEDVIAKVEDR